MSQSSTTQSGLLTPPVTSNDDLSKQEVKATQITPEQTPVLAPSFEKSSEQEGITQESVAEKPKNRMLEKLKADALWTMGYYDEDKGASGNFDFDNLAPISKRSTRPKKMITDDISTQGPKYNIVERLKKSTKSEPSNSTTSFTPKPKKRKTEAKVVADPRQLPAEVPNPAGATYGDLKRGYNKNHKRPSGLLAGLLADRQWLLSIGKNDDEPVEELGDHRRLRKRKCFIEQVAEEQELERIEKEKKKQLEWELIQKELEKNMKAREEEQLAKKAREDEEKKKQILMKALAKPERKLEKQSKKSVKAKDIKIQKIRKKPTKALKPEVSKTPVEDALGCKEEYYPFVPYIVVDNQQTSIIADKYFASEVFDSASSPNLENLVTARALLESSPHNYHDYPDMLEERKYFKIKSCVYPGVDEEYVSRGSLNHGQLDTFMEVGKIMELSTISYIPAQYQTEIFNKDAPSKSISGRFSKAVKAKEWNGVFEEINNYNRLVQEIHSKNEFIPYIKSKTEFPKLLVHEILNQVYARSILREAQKLEQYKSFSAEVYGELLPTFLSTLFVQTNLDSKSIFLDLGSGVGNVVLQAALEYGAESYGCEMMDNCNILAKKQLLEFEARSKLYGINAGKVGLFHGDFTKNEGVAEVLPRADVILITNFLFDHNLNAQVLKMLKTAKVGTRIISLKPVVPDAFTLKHTEEEYIAKLRVRRFEFQRDSVSWSSNTGFYYISEVTDTIQEAYLRPRNTRLTKINNGVYTNVSKKLIPYSATAFYEVTTNAPANVPSTTFSQTSARPMDDQFVSTVEIKFQRAKSGGSRSKSPTRKIKKEQSTELSADSTSTIYL